jgi:hypothetical protein
MPLDLNSFELGVQQYWDEIGRRAPHVQAREHAFSQLAQRYAGRNPQHFTREDIGLIMEWKHTDIRWFNRAMKGINEATDEKIVRVTSGVAFDAERAVQPFIRAFHGVGVASVSAILTAARPDLYAVIDAFVLIGIDHYYTFPWIDRMGRGKEGQLVPEYADYPAYVNFCRIRAKELGKGSKREWTPREVEMALWAVGKKLSTGGVSCY